MRQPEGYRSVSGKFTGKVVHIEFKVRNIHLTAILVNVHHVWIQTCQVEYVFNERCERELQSELLAERPEVSGGREGLRGPIAK